MNKSKVFSEESTSFMRDKFDSVVLTPPSLHKKTITKQSFSTRDSRQKSTISKGYDNSKSRCTESNQFSRFKYDSPENSTDKENIDTIKKTPDHAIILESPEKDLSPNVVNDLARLKEFFFSDYSFETKGSEDGKDGYYNLLSNESSDFSLTPKMSPIRETSVRVKPLFKFESTLVHKMWYDKSERDLVFEIENIEDCNQAGDRKSISRKMLAKTDPFILIYIYENFLDFEEYPEFEKNLPKV